MFLCAICQPPPEKFRGETHTRVAFPASVMRDGSTCRYSMQPSQVAKRTEDEGRRLLHDAPAAARSTV